jgi:tRNA threonylcarbamoyl adenosine modification protein YjeE
MRNMRKILKKYTDEFSEGSLKTFAQHMAFRVKNFPQGGKVLFLKGEIGAGKTTFTRFFSEELGGKNGSSPTFSLIEKRDLPENIVLLHGDFYRADVSRVEEIVDEYQEIAEDIQKNTPEKQVIWVLEWFPPKLIPEFFGEIPKIFLEFFHPLSNTFENHDTRNISVYFENPFAVCSTDVQNFLGKYQTPVHIQKHSEMVQKVALGVGRQLQKNKIPIDIDLIKNAALLHDALKYVDFPLYSSANPKDAERYQEAVTPEKIAIWKQVREKYLHTHHADAIAEILDTHSFFATAQVIRSHKTSSIFLHKNPEKNPKTNREKNGEKNREEEKDEKTGYETFSWEEKVLYYADKRALHDTFVSVQERLVDGSKRYQQEASPELNEKVFLLEKILETAGGFCANNLEIL